MVEVEELKRDRLPVVPMVVAAVWRMDHCRLVTGVRFLRNCFHPQAGAGD